MDRICLISLPAAKCGSAISRLCLTICARGATTCARSAMLWQRQTETTQWLITDQREAPPLGPEGIVKKRKDSRYGSGLSAHCDTTALARICVRVVARLVARSL